MKIPLAAKPTTLKAVAAKFVHTLSLDLRKDQSALSNMKTFFQHHRQEIFKVKELPAGVSPKATFPSKSELLHRRAFGKHVSCQSYTVEKSFLQIAVLLWKYPFITEVCTTLVEAFSKVDEVVYNKIHSLRNVDFSALQLLQLDWDIKEESSDAEKAVQQNKLYLRCLPPTLQYGYRGSSALLW